MKRAIVGLFLLVCTCVAGYSQNVYRLLFQSVWQRFAVELFSLAGYAIENWIEMSKYDLSGIQPLSMATQDGYIPLLGSNQIVIVSNTTATISNIQVSLTDVTAVSNFLNQTNVEVLLPVDQTDKKFSRNKVYRMRIGSSVNKYPMYAYFVRGQNSYRNVLFFASVHGDEPAGLYLMSKFLEFLASEDVELKNSLIIIPIMNPDGYQKYTRVNVNRVDLNRNLPTKNWNTKKWKIKNDVKRYNPGGDNPEDENIALMKLIARYKPIRILSLHSPMKCINYDGPGYDLSVMLSNTTKYRVQDDIGYPTPGSFGTYYGKERNIPIVTLELPPDNPEVYENLWTLHRTAFITFINF